MNHPCPKLLTKDEISHFKQNIFICSYLSILFKADYFNKTVLKIEGDSISAIDVAFHMEELRATIMLRQEEQYFGPELQEEKKFLVTESLYVESSVKKIIDKFYGSFGVLNLNLFCCSNSNILSPASFSIRFCRCCKQLSWRMD